MLRTAIFALIATAALLAQTPSPAPSPSSANAGTSSSPSKETQESGTKQAAPAGQNTQAPANPADQSKAAENAKEAAIPPTEAVVTVHGLCSTRTAAAKTAGTKTATAAPCTTKISKEKFDKLLNMVVPPNQPQQPALRRNLAQRYVELLAIAQAAEKAGVEKTPEFELARLRAVTEAYQRILDEKYRNPPPAEVDAYYNEHKDDFQSVTLRRIYIPKNDPSGKGTQEEKEAFSKKAAGIADQIRDRAAKGEDMDALQKEAYSKLGLTSSPPNTQIGPVRKGALPPAVDKEVFALSPGGVYKSDEPTAFVIYKAEKKESMPLDRVKDEISRTLHRKKLEDKLKEINSGVKADYNDAYFGPPTPPAALPPGDKR